MEYFSDTDDQYKKRRMISVVLSLLFHSAIFIAVLSTPFFSRKTTSNFDAMDVSLYDFSGSDLAFDLSDIDALQAEADISSDTAEKIEEKPASSEIVDPSSAELKRMKKRKNDRKPPPKPETGSDNFGMKTGFMPGGSGRTKGSVKLDSENFQFMYYLSMMKNRISENWIPPFGSVKSEESKRVVISFRIDRRGQVLSPEVEETSGDDLLDQSALRAVIVSNPFPSLPQGYPDASLGVHFGFVCQL